MAAGGLCGDAAGGRSSRSGLRWPAQRAPPVRPLRGCSLSCRGGIIAARPAMMRCAHGRLAQLLRAGRAVDAMSVGRILSDGRRMTATAVLQRAMAAAAAARRPQHVHWGPEALHVQFGDVRQWRKAANFKNQNCLPARALRARDVRNGSVEPCTLCRDKNSRSSGLFLTTIMRPSVTVLVVRS